jgi:hypothetical protein
MNNKYVFIKIKDGLINGLKTYYYTWSGDNAPDDLLSLKPVYTGVSPWINYVWWDKPAPSVPSEFFAIAWIGYIEIGENGMYRFYVTTDDGSRLWIDDELVIDAWKDQSPTTYVSDPVYLSRGFHKIKYFFYNRYGFAEAVLGWIPPSGEPGVIPKDRFYHCLGSDVYFTNVPDNYIVEILPTDRERVRCISHGGVCRISLPQEAYPIEAIIRLYDDKSKLVYESGSRVVIWGGDEFKLVLAE